jgi:serine/threonine protein kinase
MHKKSIFHRDIKIDNIIYNPKTEMIKIIDFGFATISKEPLKVFCGTPSYMSPEIV